MPQTKVNTPANADYPLKILFVGCRENTPIGKGEVIAYFESERTGRQFQMTAPRDLIVDDVALQRGDRLTAPQFFFAGRTMAGTEPRVSASKSDSSPDPSSSNSNEAVGSRGSFLWRTVIPALPLLALVGFGGFVLYDDAGRVGGLSLPEFSLPDIFTSTDAPETTDDTADGASDGAGVVAEPAPTEPPVTLTPLQLRQVRTLEVAYELLGLEDELQEVRNYLARAQP